MAPKDVLIDNPARLPGAFLILNVTYAATNRKPNTVIAYDPEIQDKDKFSSCIPRWNENGLPYREDFTPDTFVNLSKDYHSGVYGINGNRSTGSNPWPWKDINGHKLQYGINISFWNENEARKGLFTNAAMKPINTKPVEFTTKFLQPFKAESRTSVMTLNPGKSTQLKVPANEKLLPDYTSITLEYYAMRGTIVLNA